MKKIEPQVQKIRETVKDKQEQAKQLMQLYKSNDVNPFAGILLIIIQLPILMDSIVLFAVAYQQLTRRFFIVLCPNQNL
jgi:YidC/Oxa1 family membrane protein insertase